MSFLCLKPLMCWLLFPPGPRPPCAQALPLAPIRCRPPWPGPAPRLPDARLPWGLAVPVSSVGWLLLFSAWPAPSPTVTSAFKPLTTCWRVAPQTRTLIFGSAMQPPCPEAAVSCLLGGGRKVQVLEDSVILRPGWTDARCAPTCRLGLLCPALPPTSQLPWRLLAVRVEVTVRGRGAW